MRLSHCWTREEMKSYGCVRCQLKQLSEHRNSFQPVVRIKKEQTCIHVNQIVEFFHHRLQSSSLICFCCHVGSRTQTTALLWKAKLYLLGELMNWCTWNISVSIRLTLSSNTMRMNDWSQWQHNIFFKKKQRLLFISNISSAFIIQCVFYYLGWICLCCNSLSLNGLHRCCSHGSVTAGNIKSWAGGICSVRKWKK